MKISHHQLLGKFRQYSYIILAVCFFALFTHGAHGETLSQPEHDLVCQLCQSPLDNNPAVDIDTIQHQRVIRLHVLADKPSTPKAAKFFRPSLRAPPY